MKHFVFSIFDQKAKAFTPPFFMHSEGMAHRAFMDQVNNKESQIHAHPEDYTLFKIGEFDDNAGAISGMSPQTMVNGLQVIEDAAEQNQSAFESIIERLDQIERKIDQ
jgi:hypothetical protein